MSQLYMIELQPDTKGLLRFLRSQGLESSMADEDLGYGAHAWLRAAFGDLAPQPWRLLQDGRRPLRVLGYSTHSAQRLEQRMSEFADPAVYAVCPPNAVEGRKMPSWRADRHLGFELLACPVGRKARSGTEKDLFLIRADQAGEEQIDRDAVYCQWVRERVQRDQAATVLDIRLDGFRLVKQSRPARSSSEQGRLRRIVRPRALLRGKLAVNDPVTFSHLLEKGVGRHRAFGYGMLLLRPPP